jgi:hypothetical protein
MTPFLAAQLQTELDYLLELAQLTAVIVAIGILMANLSKDAFEIVTVSKKHPLDASVIRKENQLRLDSKAADHARSSLLNHIGTLWWIVVIGAAYSIIGTFIVTIAMNSHRWAQDSQTVISFAEWVLNLKFITIIVFVFLAAATAYICYYLLDVLRKINNCRLELIGKSTD